MNPVGAEGANLTTIPHPFLNTVRRWLPRERAHSWRARHTRTPTPTPGDGTNTGLQHTTPTTGPYYQGPARPTDWHRARKKELTG